jgi:hypothetical protein|tara:strand:- start:921 stop:1037 length:117 start_codon:yes stop_codon:yes gene_type:complete
MFNDVTLFVGGAVILAVVVFGAGTVGKVILGRKRSSSS